MRGRIGIAVIGALFVILGGGEGAGPWARDLIITNNARLLTTSIRSQFDPAISGDIIVFTDTRFGSPALFYIDLREEPVVVRKLNGATEGDEADADMRMITEETVRLYLPPRVSLEFRDAPVKDAIWGLEKLESITGLMDLLKEKP